MNGSDAMTSTESHTHRCQRPGCNRKLTSARSQRDGYGRTCRRKMAAALAGLSDQQVDEAIEIAENRGVRPTSRPGVYAVQSGDFTTEYRTTPAGPCSCRHGVGITAVGDNPCKHVGALRVYLITVRRTRRALTRRRLTTAA